MMRRNGWKRTKYDQRDHTIATVTKIVLGAAGVLAGLVFLRSLPDLIRYLKIERM